MGSCSLKSSGQSINNKYGGNTYLMSHAARRDDEVSGAIQRAVQEGLFGEVAVEVVSVDSASTASEITSRKLFHGTVSKGGVGTPLVVCSMLTGDRVRDKSLLGGGGKRVVDIASVTKLLINLLAYRLMTISPSAEYRGKRFGLDAFVSDFLPLVGDHADKLQVKHLFNFHARMNTFSRPEEISARANVRASFMSELCSVGLATPPGEEFAYANWQSVMLGVILEKVFGEHLRSLMERHLLIPLGMTDTSPDASLIPDFVKRRMASPKGLDPSLVFDPVARAASAEGDFIGSAGLFSTVNDLEKMVRMLLQRGRRHGEVFIDESYLRLLSSPQGSKGKFGMGAGLIDVLRQGLEGLNPRHYAGGFFKSGWRGQAVFVFPMQGLGIILGSDFLARQSADAGLEDKRAQALLAFMVRLIQAVIEQHWVI